MTNSAASSSAASGEIDDQPRYREHQLVWVQRWLAARGGTLALCQRSWLYGDAIAALPLLRAVNDPEVVRPDTRSRALAPAAGWPVLEGNPGGGEAKLLDLGARPKLLTNFRRPYF